MSPIKKITLSCMLLLGGLIFMAGCGSSTANPDATNSAEGQHSSGWLPAGHMIAAQKDLSSCAECHGSAYDGGISGVSCTQCHLGDKSSVHPLDWVDQILIKHGAYVGSSGTTSHGNTACANINCHGADLSGVTDSGPSCTSCHMGGVSSAHPSTWTSASVSHRDYVLLNPGDLPKCANAACHGSNFAGVTGSGPSCTSCHSETYYDCTSCHGQPPATGKHVFHVSSENKTCVDCHQLTSALHDNGTVNLVSSITYSFTTKSCTPSCHGTETW
jgi:hypothetical protein